MNDYRFTAKSQKTGKTYAIIATPVVSPVIAFDAGDGVVHGHEFRLEDDTPVKKFADMMYRLPSGEILVTEDGDAP